MASAPMSGNIEREVRREASGIQYSTTIMSDSSGAQLFFLGGESNCETVRQPDYFLQTF